MAGKTAPKRAPRVYRDPIKYEVGTDLPLAVYDELVTKVADWFAEWRDTKEPAADARFRLKCCLEGKTLEGQPWFSHWQSSFKTRVAMMCRFDVEKMAPIRTGSEKLKAKKDRAKLKAAEKRRDGDPMIPELTKKELGSKNVKYGDNPHVLLTEAEAKQWHVKRLAYTEQFAELRTVNAQAELDLLCDLHVIHERNRLKLLKGEYVDPKTMEGNIGAMVNLKKALGIHPDQLAKKVQEEISGTVSEAVVKLETHEHGRALRARYWLEEMLIAWQMYMTASPRKDTGGYQLDEIGLFGLTKCRTCHCAKCGHRNFVGVSVEEVERYLVQQGVLWPADPVPDNPRALPVVEAPVE